MKRRTFVASLLGLFAASKPVDRATRIAAIERESRESLNREAKSAGVGNRTPVGCKTKSKASSSKASTTGNGGNGQQTGQDRQ